MSTETADPEAVRGQYEIYNLPKRLRAGSKLKAGSWTRGPRLDHLPCRASNGKRHLRRAVIARPLESLAMHTPLRMKLHAHALFLSSYNVQSTDLVASWLRHCFGERLRRRAVHPCCRLLAVRTKASQATWTRKRRGENGNDRAKVAPAKRRQLLSNFSSRPDGED